MKRNLPDIQFEKPIVLGGNQTKWKEAPTPSLYANVTALQVSPFDITLLFGQIESASQTELSAAPLVKVILSPEHAALVAHLLSGGVDQFVSLNGQLRSKAIGAIEEKPS